MAFALDIRKNDIVEVIAGRSKGPSGQPTRGRVLRVEPQKRRVFVEHVNMVKRHVRPNPAKQIRGGILEREGPIHVSSVQLVCSECGPTRIQHREMAGGKKVRICVKCEKSLDA
jgi:large subunit ribosomal protein L24